MSHALTRRTLLGILPASLWSARVSEKNQSLPYAGEFVRFADPTTENLVIRLTTPVYSCLLPQPGRGFVSLKPRMLYCASDRAGGPLAPFEIDLRSGAMRHLAETEALDAGSLGLDAPGKTLYFVDGGTLRLLPLNGKREMRKTEIVAEGIGTYALGPSRNELFLVRNGSLRRLAGNEKSEELLVDHAEAPCLVRPGGRGCIFGRHSAAGEQEFWYFEAAAKPVLLASGAVRNPYWSADGHSLLFLRDVPLNSALISQVREINPEDRVERCLAPTSQFASFAPNGNDSVFVGASRSKAQPNIVLLLRSPQREMTLCEHHASHPAETRPSFSPDSRRVYFQSDREGKPAIYSVNVEQLVEPT